MENFFEKALSQNIENEADSFLSLAVAHTVFKVKVFDLPTQKPSNMKVARVFNAFFENGFNHADYQFLGKKLVEEMLGVLADKNGINRPQFEIADTSIFSGQMAGACAANKIRFCNKKIVGQSKFNGQTFGQTVKSAGHESQHLFQFFNIKEYLTGHDVDIKYKIMAFQEIFEFCGITTSKLDFFANEKYWYCAMEIDARKTGSDLVFDLIDNPFTSPKARQSLVNFATSQLEESATLYNCGTKLLKQLAWQEKKFKKEFGDCPLAKDLLKEFNALKPQIRSYASKLDCFGCELPAIIMDLRKFEARNIKAQKQALKEPILQQKN